MFNNPFSLVTDPTHSLFSGRFRRANSFLSQWVGDESLKRSPAYDICQQDDNQYVITVSVPGFRQEELSINARDGQIVIDGQREPVSQGTNTSWLHRGINSENFRLTFAFKTGIEVQNAKLDNGLLTINLLQKIPERAEFKEVAIGNGG